jgi:hypothetical protein
LSVCGADAICASQGLTNFGTERYGLTVAAARCKIQLQQFLSRAAAADLRLKKSRNHDPFYGGRIWRPQWLAAGRKPRRKSAYHKILRITTIDILDFGRAGQATARCAPASFSSLPIAAASTGWL